MSYERTARHVAGGRRRPRSIVLVTSRGRRLPPFVVTKRNDQGRAVDGRTAYWLQPYPPAPTDQPYSEHLRLYPNVNEGDVTTFQSWTTVSLRYWTHVAAAYWQRSRWSALTHFTRTAADNCFGNMIIFQRIFYVLAFLIIITSMWSLTASHSYHVTVTNCKSLTQWHGH